MLLLLLCEERPRSFAVCLSDGCSVKIFLLLLSNTCKLACVCVGDLLSGITALWEIC